MSDSEETVHVAAAQIFVQRSYKNNLTGEETEDPPKEETIAVHKFQTEPAAVNLSFGLTLNLGNYESARLDVGGKFPCYKEEWDDTFEWAKAKIEERVADEVADIKENKSKNLF